MPRPYKPQPLQKPRMNMGMGMGLPSPESIVSFNAKNPVDPSSMVWHHMSRENQMKMYLNLVKKTNQRLRELENRGMTDSPIYKSLESKGYVTNSGNVGFSTAGSKKWSSSTLKKEYSKVYNAYKAPSSSASKKEYRERMTEMLSHIGVDYDEMMENPEMYKQELNEFWSLYNEAKRAGLWKQWGLGSYEAQEIVKEFQSDARTMPKIGRGAYQVALSARKKTEELNNESVGMNQDAYKQRVLVIDYNAKKMRSARDLLLNKLGENAWGTTPIETVTTGEKKKDYLV